MKVPSSTSLTMAVGHNYFQKEGKKGAQITTQGCILSPHSTYLNIATSVPILHVYYKLETMLDTK